MAGSNVLGALNKVTEAYLKLPLSQKIAIPALIVLSAALLVIVIRWSQKPDYAVLFSDLDQVDAAAIIEHLKSKKIAYNVRPDGKTIEVYPASLVPELRIMLASAGLPKGSSFGFEILDNLPVGASAFLEKIKLQRAIQGELERTIKSIDGVLAARVHIAHTEKSLFKQGAKPTASVYLKILPGKQLSPEQINGIAHLVAGSVEGLTKDRVTIIDQNGNLLSSSDPELDKELVTTKTKLEAYHSKQLEELLTRVLGPGKAVARVSIELDNTEAVKEEEIFDPNLVAVRSEKSVSAGATTEAGRGGVPGVVSNLPDASNLVVPATEKSSQSAESLRNFEVSRSYIKSQTIRGAIKKISVAVVVDGEWENVTLEDGSVTKKFKPLPPERLLQLEQIIKRAIGFNPARGDTVAVESVPFYTPDDSIIKDLESGRMFSNIMQAIQIISPIILALLLFFVVIKPVVKNLISKSESELDLERLLPTGLKELEKEMQQERKVTATLPEIETSVDIEQLEQLLADNTKLVLENPNQAALLIRYWLNEGKI